MARAETAPAGTKPRIVRAAGSPRFTAERSACRTSQRHSGVGSRIHRREVAIKAVGLSLPMWFRLFGDRPANQEFRVVLEQVEQLEHRLRIVLEGAQRGAHGRRGRVPLGDEPPDVDIRLNRPLAKTRERPLLRRCPLALFRYACCEHLLYERGRQRILGREVNGRTGELVRLRDLGLHGFRKAWAHR